MQQPRLRTRSRAPRRHGPLHLVLIAALCAGWLACDGGAKGPDEGVAQQRYQFVRAQRLLVRMNTSTGQAWFVPHTGDGGWTITGGVPDAAGRPDLPGRYRLHIIEASRRTLGDATQRVLRVDLETGRAWTMELLDGASWVGIDEPEGAALAPDAAPAGPAPRATPSPAPAGAQGQAAPRSALDVGVISRERIDQDADAGAQFARDLTEALQKEGMPPDVQAWSARQLGVFPKEVAVPPLLGALDSEHSVVVVAAIHALRQTGDVSTIPRILKLQSHPDPAVRAAVQEVVAEIQ